MPHYAKPTVHPSSSRSARRDCSFSNSAGVMIGPIQPSSALSSVVTVTPAAFMSATNWSASASHPATGAHADTGRHGQPVTGPIVNTIEHGRDKLTIDDEDQGAGLLPFHLLDPPQHLLGCAFLRLPADPRLPVPYDVAYGEVHAVRQGLSEHDELWVGAYIDVPFQHYR